MSTVKVNASSSYDVVIEKGIISTAGEYCKAVLGSCKVVIVTDDKVAPLYLDAVKSSFQIADCETVEFVIENGEQSKNLDEFIHLLEFMAQNKITRSDVVVALGGGVVGDLAGFAAAVYLRGVRFVQIPTTLLAMVDSSVGGKTAVNLNSVKNLAGAFYQPDLVLCDCSALDTLEPEVFAEGMAEVIKYGMIFDKELFNFVKSGKVKENIETVITRCVELKRDVVEKDEYDSGERQLLNFGHTIGHAIEKCSNHTISHGNAVAVGMLIASKASFASGWCDENCIDELLSALKNNSLPTECSFTEKELFEAALSDKKRNGDEINLVVPQKIGKCIIKKTPVDCMYDFIKSGI